ncbi:MAG: sel1 repeat family protein [Betaproteobacteria bacterium]|nr:sel1 repeat family protein [Betaproteobacteria bacterium]
MIVRSVSIKCPNCQSDRLRRSHRRPDDSPWRSLFRTVYRCRQCGMRTYYRTSWLGPGVAAASLLVLTFVLGFALGSLRRPALPDATVAVGSAPALDDNVSEARSASAPRPTELSLAVAAEGGDAKAQLQLGMVYMKGAGVERNPATALKWIQKSAEQGYAEAQHALGSIHQSGRATMKDYQLAFKWFEQAAEQNHAEAQYSLGVLFSNGQGVVVDQSLAYTWFSLAAAQGHERAGDERDYLKSVLLPEELLAAQAAAQQWRAARAKR